jgi:hypothetical protein
MNSASIKLDLLERLAGVRDESVIKRMAELLQKAFPEVMSTEDEDDISDEEYASFQEELAQRDRGEIRFYSEEESIRMIRDGSADKTRRPSSEQKLISAAHRKSR